MKVRRLLAQLPCAIIVVMLVKMTFDGVVNEVAVTDHEMVKLLNGEAIAYMADNVEPFGTKDLQLGECIQRPEIES